MSNYFLIAGEASGDTHAAELIQQIRLRDPDARFAGLGGDKMRAAGCQLYQDYRHMAFMGFAAVIQHWKDVKTNFRIAHEALFKEQPDVLILIDYPSFNLRMAAFCKRHLPQTKVIYYIPPKVWAWKRRRVHKIAKLCDEVLGIFPFEPAFYARYGYRCTYVGNPTAEEIANHKSQITNSYSPRLTAIRDQSLSAEDVRGGTSFCGIPSGCLCSSWNRGRFLHSLFKRARHAHA